MLSVRTLTDTPIPSIMTGRSRDLARLGPETSPRSSNGTQMMASGPKNDSHSEARG